MRSPYKKDHRMLGSILGPPLVEAPKSATVDLRGSRAIFRVDIGLYIGMIIMNFPKVLMWDPRPVG